MSRPKVLLFVLLALVIGLGGCANLPFLKSEQPEPPVSYHFPDIKVPGSLEIDPKRSFVFETGGLKAGTLFFSGYVNVDSLVSYFKDSLPSEGWKLKSIFHYPTMVLLFEKENKVCIISIFEKTIYTHVEIRVAPFV
ncbi:MAG: hypothetical protein V1742_01320 [Pseudomonadota bacterium]